MTSRMFAAISAALVAAVLSLAGASLVVAGQPQAGGNSGHANNGNGHGNGNGGGDQASPPAPAPAAAPAPGAQSGFKHENKAERPAHANGPQRHAAKQQAAATAPAPAAAPAPTQTAKGGGSHSTATSGPGNSGQGCDGSHNSNTGHGANHSGPYDNTCDGSPSGNGNGNGKATGKPCAGCVGNADDKNPKGQYPNGSDHNAGYECDRNHGIGRSNPAHTGCQSTQTPPTTPPSGCTKPNGCEEHGGGGGCPETAKLSTAVTQAAALALKAIATVHPELAKFSEIAASATSEKCGEDSGGHTPGGHGHGHSHGKITICHATGSATNPYVEITISVNGLHGHGHHQDSRDIIPAPAGGCPAGSSTTPGQPGGTTPGQPGGTTPGQPGGKTPGQPGVTPTTQAGTPPASTFPPAQQEVLGEQQSGSTSPAGTTAPAAPGQNAVLGVNAQGTAPAAATPPAAANRSLPAESAGGSLPFTGTDAILVLLLGCVLLLGGITLYRVAARRAG